MDAGGAGRDMDHMLHCPEMKSLGCAGALVDEKLARRFIRRGERRSASKRAIRRCCMTGMLANSGGVGKWFRVREVQALQL